ncbi:tetratricopeptide repeat protein [Acidaminobacter sp. JC074]|uniref:tetratricopeptide repeat protein n=1 Tax=Acidaminobacter sp. JC074 TaxID=2530199 RepID=UPI001F1081C8|nr:tetratricopeptide repeat protein [Acidaminobacter sp. JC074]
MKRVIIVLILLSVLVSCSSPEVKENTESKKVDDEILDERVVNIDPLVQYAMNNIDFEFVSDSGHYTDYKRISKSNYSNKDMIRDIEALSQLIEDQDFAQLRDKILTIPDYNNLMREVKINYIVPILMHENNYLDALRIVYKKEQIETKEDRFLFDIIYLMRYMYVNNDLDYAIALVDKLKEEFPKGNVSYVWFAISPRQYEVLNNTGIVYPPNQDGDRNILWRYLVDNYPDDRHIDYAYYFLGDYQKIIDDYPESVLLEKAIYARADKLSNAVRRAIYNDKETLDRVDLALAKDYYQDYLRTYPDSKYAYRAVSDIKSLCRTMCWHYGEDDHYYDFLEAIKEMDYDKRYYSRYSITESILYSLKYEYIGSNHLIEVSNKAKAFLEDEDVYSYNKYFIWSGLANNAFYKGELELADMYFSKIEKYDYDEFDLYRLIVLSELKPLLGKEDKEALFEKAEILRDHEEYYASVYIYNKLIKLKLSDEELSKAYMLRASSSKKNRVYDEMLESYEYIFDHLDKTVFADDALAEIGVHYLLTEKDYDKAREIFRQVIKKYPETNAVNNAYNWIAWSYLQEKDYEHALTAYEELKDKFPTNRFGRNAVPNIKKIKEKLEAED